jgi:Fe-S-cluster containining protein
MCLGGDNMCSPLLIGLQSRFKCLGCGKCCQYGGDIELTADEVGKIMLLFSHGLNHDLAQEFVPVPHKPGYFRFKQIFPCGFFNLVDKKCMIYTARPEACKNYPFMSLAKGETTLAGVTICEGASRQVTEEFFNDKEP